MTAVLLALVASVFYGSSQFLAGRASVRTPPAIVSLVELGVAGSGTLVVAVVVHPCWAAGSFGWGLLAGLVAAVGVLALYTALSRGVVSTVEALASSGLAIPVLVDVSRGDRVTGLTLAGLVMVAVGLVTLSTPARAWAIVAALRARRTNGSSAAAAAPAFPLATDTLPAARGVGTRPAGTDTIALGLVTALTFGVFYLLADRAVADQPGLPVWADLGLLVGAAIVTLPAALHARHRTRDVVPVPVPWPAAGCGLLDAVADLALLVALQRGPLSAVSVLSNLDPVVASLLALWLLHERPGPRTGLAATTMIAGSLLLTV